ncbi:MAG: sensor domain-containing diguanylate cyclase [Bacillota bacterium]
MSENTIINDAERYKLIIEGLKDIIWEMDSSFVFTYVSPVVKEVLGYEPWETEGKYIMDLLADESKEYLFLAMRRASKEMQEGIIMPIIRHKLEMICKDGSTKWMEITAKSIIKDGKHLGYFGTSSDISDKKIAEKERKRYIEELKIANEKLETLATTDLLTGAYNRRKFDEILEISVIRRNRDNIPFVLIMIDIDHFKKINDTYGHKVGDIVLKELARTLKELLGSDGSLFRWGGEEFMILLPQYTLINGIGVVERIQKRLGFTEFQGVKSLTVSLSIAEYKINEDIDRFLIRVDNALLQAKNNGRNRYELSL